MRNMLTDTNNEVKIKNINKIIVQLIIYTQKGKWKTRVTSRFDGKIQNIKNKCTGQVQSIPQKCDTMARKRIRHWQHRIMAQS